MATRVTADEVEEIIDTDLGSSRIEAFITGANEMVNEFLTGQGLSDSLLKEIERWLAAHYIAATFERQATKEKAGPVEQQFSDVFGENLKSTTYGQTAAQLDPTNKLSNAGKKAINVIAVNEDYS